MIEAGGAKVTGILDNSDSKRIDYHEIIECIVSALDAKDSYTAGHSQRVSDMALMVCNLIGLKQNDVEEIHIAAHLHDIGKMYDPIIGEYILNHWEEVVGIITNDKN